MNKLISLRTISTSSVLAALLLHCSCREKGEVQHFRTAKENKAAQSGGSDNPGSGPSVQTPQPPSSPAKKAPYTWTLPKGWTAQPASGMRLATILIPSGSGTMNASITEFGGDLAGNVNRWRGQIGLPPLQAAAIPASLKEVETGLGKGYIVLLTNPASLDNAMLAAIIPRPSGRSPRPRPGC